MEYCEIVGNGIFVYSETKYKFYKFSEILQISIENADNSSLIYIKSDKRFEYLYSNTSEEQKELFNKLIQAWKNSANKNPNEGIEKRMDMILERIDFAPETGKEYKNAENHFLKK